jgi:recombination protein RecT
LANVNGGLAKQQQMNAAASTVSVKGLLANVNYKKRFEEILGKKAAGFMSSIINISNSTVMQGVEPTSIISSAVVAATLDLPIDPNLGFAYIVPYNDKNKGKVAQFQLGYKGFIQLAMRSGQYKTINAVEVYEGDIKRVNRLTGEIEFNEDNCNDEKIVGYIAFFQLLNGFEKALYMTKEQIEKHAKRYSQTYKSEKDYVVRQSKWSTDFDAMAIKTVLKLLLSKYGILSIEIQKALETDQAVIKNDVANGADVNSSTVEYVDNMQSEVQDVTYSAVEQSGDSQNTYQGTPFEGEE